jgi:hypothetical protein
MGGPPKPKAQKAVIPVHRGPSDTCAEFVEVRGTKVTLDLELLPQAHLLQFYSSLEMLCRRYPQRQLEVAVATCKALLDARGM